MWIGPSKPPFKHLLEPLMEEINHLTTVGMTIKLSNNSNVTVKVKLVLGIFDLPAKASVLCCKQFNGQYGCSVCYHPGMYMCHRRVYPPCASALRTHEQIVSDGKEAIECGKPKRGVMSTSPLVNNLNLVDSIPVDYMHAILEGIMKKLMDLWFSSKSHGKPYYLRKSLKSIDSALMKQAPPDEFTRAPRCIQLHMKYWKASELKQWLLYYSLPLLQNKLPDVHWLHFSLLVCITEGQHFIQ